MKKIFIFIFNSLFGLFKKDSDPQVKSVFENMNRVQASESFFSKNTSVEPKKDKSKKKFFLMIVLFLIFDVIVFSAVYTYVILHAKIILNKEDGYVFTVEKGMYFDRIAKKLRDEGVLDRDFIFKTYMKFKGYDSKVQAGEYVIPKEFSIIELGDILQKNIRREKIITILPGWSLRDIAVYFEKENMVSQNDFFAIVGKPADKNTEASFENSEIFNFYADSFLKSKPENISFEGYFAPDTYRVYADEAPENIIKKTFEARARYFSDPILESIEQKKSSVHEILTLASIVEREVRSSKDRAKVADIFWRRYRQNWRLEADSTVHYLVGKTGDVFTTSADRAIDSPWNTYKKIGLPMGPISNPSNASIDAVLNPEANDYWFFLTTPEGEVKYAKTYEEHLKNVRLYLR